MSGDRAPGVYVESPLDRIVNVNFGGLAVEFGDGAGAPPSAGPVRQRLSRGPKAK
jgi:hypothetical protein